MSLLVIIQEKEDLSEADIEDEINKEAKTFETVLEVKFKRDKELNEKCLSFTENKEENRNHFPHAQTREEANENPEPKFELKAKRNIPTNPNLFPLAPNDTFWFNREE